MKRTFFYTLTVLLAFLGLARSAQGDISEYFLRDPYDQLDLFRQSITKATEVAEEEEAASTEIKAGGNDDGLYEEYYDYLYDVGALPAKETTTSTTTEKPKSSPKPPSLPRLQLRKKNPLTVADDVLGRVKKPNKGRKSPKKRYSYRYRPGDNVAAEAAAAMKRHGKPHRGHLQPKNAKPALPIKISAAPRQQLQQPQSPRDLPGLENVERLIPSSLKTVIEDSGKRIVKAVMQPINSIPRNTHIKETSFSSKMESWLQPYRSYFGYMAPTFAPAHITSFLVTQWVSTIAITIAWITVGYMWQSMTGRSSEGRSIEPWESLVPDSGTMAVVLQDLSDAAQRWHDEL